MSANDLMINTHILAPEFELHAATTVEQAVALLAQYGSAARVLAGGTDLLVKMKLERERPGHVIHIGRIAELGRIAGEDGGLALGALVTFYQLQKSPLVREKYQALHEAAHSVSSTQIKIMGTLGGNLCNASPAADAAPALLVFDAEVELAGQDGTRRVALDGFFTGPGHTVLAPGELLTHIHLPPVAEGAGSAFLKLGRVEADIAKVSAAVRLERDGERVVACRIALGSVAPTPVRAREAEAILAGKTFDRERAEEAGRIAALEIRPITDTRSTAAYRMQAGQVLVRDALLAAWARSES